MGERIACGGAKGRPSVATPVQSKRGPGAPLGNRNRLRHGRRSDANLLRQRQRAALLKGAALLLRHMGGLLGRCQARPLRHDQVEHIPPEWLPIIAPWFAQETYLPRRG